MLNRREFAASVAATTAVTIPFSGVAATNQPLAGSPLFAKPDAQAKSFRMRYDRPGWGRVSMSILCLTPTRPIRDTRHAEDILFAMAPQIDYGNGPMLRDESARLACNIVRAGNRIAARTRRGAGNCIFMHPDDVRLLPKDATKFTRAETIGRWNKVGTFLSRQNQIFVSDTANKGTLHVAYVGRPRIDDGPAQIILTDHGPYLALLEEGHTYLGGTADYLQRLDFG